MFEPKKKACSSHMGVKIYRTEEMITGSNMRELKNGEFRPCNPKFRKCFCIKDGYPLDSIEECKVTIQNIWHRLLKTEDITTKEFAELMNTEERD